METTERIVESYVRYVRGWATIPNIKCNGQFEIDLIAVDPVTLARYHIESGVSISSGFSKLTDKPFSAEELKIRTQQPAQRRTLGYFTERKFGSPEILEALSTYGFKSGNYTRVIVSWGWLPEVAEKCKLLGIELWDFRRIVLDIHSYCEERRTYFTDDIVRTIHLFAKAVQEQEQVALGAGA
jgi:hypothetical protein